jgi:hypothetical protein
LKVASLLAASGDGFLYALNASTGQQRWRYPNDKPLSRGIWATPVVANDTVYAAGLDGSLHAVNLATGQPQWAQPFKAEGAFAGSPLASGETIYIGSFDRRFYALDGNDGTLRWSTTADGWFWTKPLLANGLLYAPRSTTSFMRLMLAPVSSGGRSLPMARSLRHRSLLKARSCWPLSEAVSTHSIHSLDSSGALWGLAPRCSAPSRPTKASSM